MVLCEFCGNVMTSAPSHMDHLRECANNPAVYGPLAMEKLVRIRERVGPRVRDYRSAVEAIRKILDKKSDRPKQGGSRTKTGGFHWPNRGAHGSVSLDADDVAMGKVRRDVRRSRREKPMAEDLGAAANRRRVTPA
jgi:hypothetical protein